MILLESLLVALSTYSIIPMPQFEWNEKNMKYALSFLPVVGIVCGALLFGWYELCISCEFSSLLFAIVAVSIPVLVTGGIHLDGYMDTRDALASHQTKERKLEILKDPHCGAFAVIYCIVYFILSIAFYNEIYPLRTVLVMCPAFVLSRALSVLCAVNIPGAKNGGMLKAYTENTVRAKVNIAMSVVALLSAAGMVLISAVTGGIALGCGGLSVLYYCLMVRKQFGGVTGDTAGYFLQIFELACLLGTMVGTLVQIALLL